MSRVVALAGNLWLMILHEGVRGYSFRIKSVVHEVFMFFVKV
jgi:hypothetical protein